MSRHHSRARWRSGTELTIPVTILAHLRAWCEKPKEGTLYRKGIRSPGKSRTFEIPRTTDDSNWPRTPAVLEFEYVLYLVGIVVRHKARDKERWQGWGTHSSCASFCSAGACRRLKTLWTDASARVLFPHAAARNPLPGRPSSFQGIFESQHLGRTAGAQEEITCVNLRTDLVKTLFASWHQPFFSEILQFC